MSLAERAKVVERWIGHRFSIYKLRKLYQEQKVKFKTIKIRRTWRRVTDEKKMESDRNTLRVLKEKVKECKDSKTEFVFIDECLFNQK